METIIKRAIEGGLKEGIEGYWWTFQHSNSYWAIWKNGNGDLTNIDLKHYVLDPLFWQSLGKACGWGVTDDCWGCTYDEGATENTPYWKYYALQFHEKNLTEGWDAAVKWLNEIICK